MKIVVIGATGLIGSKLVTLLRERKHEVVAASPSSGVNTLTGEGLSAALAGAQVVVDVTNSPSLEGGAARKFFETSSRVLLAAEAVAGVRHHVILSVVGTERLQESGYFQAKLLQEKLVGSSGVPYSILRSTQFFEFIERIADAASDGKTIRLSPALVQPILADEAVEALADVALAAPAFGMVEVGGPGRFPLADIARLALRAKCDPRTVTDDADARYFGVRLNDGSLVPGNDARVAKTSFESWLGRTAPRAVAEPA